jgi:hypothetical protein
MRYTLGDTTDVTSTDTGPSGQPSWLQQLVTGFTQYKIGQQQLDAFKQLNAQRIAAGLPPLTYDPATIGAPAVQVGLSASTQQLVTYGLLALGGLVVLNMVLRPRRR